MHYVVTKDKDAIIKVPITAEAAETLPDFIKELANAAERSQSHIEIDAETGIAHTVTDQDKFLSPVEQVKRAVETQYVYDKHNKGASETIKEIKSKAFTDNFNGHVYAFIYITPGEFQCSLLVLDEEGKCISSYDELEERFMPEVDGFGESAINDAKKVFERATEQYKELLNVTFKSSVIVKH